MFWHAKKLADASVSYFKHLQARLAKLRDKNVEKRSTEIIEINPISSTPLGLVTNLTEIIEANPGLESWVERWVSVIFTDHSHNGIMDDFSLV